jgi:hypothetical protein
MRCDLMLKNTQGQQKTASLGAVIRLPSLRVLARAKKFIAKQRLSTPKSRTEVRGR